MILSNFSSILLKHSFAKHGGLNVGHFDYSFDISDGGKIIIQQISQQININRFIARSQDVM